MAQKPKHENIRTWFNLQAKPRKPFVIDGVKYKSLTVRPFNGEAAPKRMQNVKNATGPGWSHGFAHFEIRETGTAGFCGTQFFEDNAVRVKTAAPRR